MDVVRHHNPRRQPISHAVEEQKRVLNQAGSLRLTQQAASMSAVDPCFDALTPFGVPAFRWDGTKLLFQTLQHTGRKAVGQVERDVLDLMVRVKVRQVAA